VDEAPPAQEGEGAPTAPAKPKRIAPKPMPARFQATVFQLDIAADQIAALDAKSLVSKVTTAPALEVALKGLGSARALYRVDQGIDLRTRSQLTIQSNVPVISSVSTVGDKKSTSVSRESLGAKFNLQSGLDAEDDLTGAIPLAITVEISALADSGVEIGGASAKVHRSVSQTNGGTMTLGKPVILIAADGVSVGNAPTGKTMATAFVTLIELSADGQ
jgi:hypothetical protein